MTSNDLSKEIVINNKLGLHARASARLVHVTSLFECHIELTANGLTVNAKSILGMMTLAASCGTKLTVRCAGDDASEAMTAVIDCIENRFGEDE